MRRAGLRAAAASVGLRTLQAGRKMAPPAEFGVRPPS
jgi:hypothetical protein